MKSATSSKAPVLAGWLVLTLWLVLGALALIVGGPAEAREPSYGMGAPVLSSPTLALARPAVVQIHGIAVDGAPGQPLYQRRRTWGGPSDRRSWKQEKEQRGWFTVRGGVFDSKEITSNDYTIGFKAMGKLSDFFNLGVQTDLQRRSSADFVREEEFTDPAGNVVRSSVTTFAASSNLYPIMAVFDIELPTKGFHPYAGLAGGYEILVVEWEDFDAGVFSRSNYGGWGWQAHGGLAIPFGERISLTGEVYMNRATVSRDVIDVDTGDQLTERINVDGEGLRAGLRLGF